MLNQKKILVLPLLSTVFFSACLLSKLLVVNANDECKDVLSTIIQRQMKTMKECMDEMNLKNGKEKVSKMLCVIKCSLAKEGFLAKDGNVDLIGSMNFLESFPEGIKEKALMLFMGCHKHMGKVNPNEESCKSYEPLLKCSQAVINKLCTDETNESPGS